MSPRIVLITGCTKGGMGFYLAEEFAKKGCIVYASARRLDSMKELTHDNIRRVVLDVTSDEGVLNVVQKILEKEGRTDILVSNAGAHCGGPLLDISLEEVKEAFDTNFFATVRLTRTIVPQMVKRKSGTIVVIGSVSGLIPHPFVGVYSSTKAALHSYTEVLRQETSIFGLKVMLVTPGAVQSNLGPNQLERYIMPSNSLYRAYYDTIVTRINMSRGSNALPSEEFAEKVVTVALKANLPSHFALGGYTLGYKFLQWLPRVTAISILWKLMVRRKGPNHTASSVPL